MAVGDNRYKLKVVEDETSAPESVVRLSPQRIGQVEVLPRLELPPDEVKPSFRLHPPAIESQETRTHQPGIEAIIENSAPDPTLTEEDWGKESVEYRSIPWGWFALIGLLLAGAVIWSLVGVQEAEVKAAERAVTTESILVDDEKENMDASRLLDRIESTTRAYFKATKIEDFVPLVRHSERVRLLMDLHYGDKPIEASPVSRILQLRPLTLGNRANFWMVSVQLQNSKTQNLIVEIEKTGEPRIDWETAVCYQPLAWNRYVQERPSGVSLDFRVCIEIGTFFSHEFADSDRWDCFRVTVLDSDEPVYGYTASGGALSQELRSLITENQGQKISVIARLHIPERIQSRSGVVIEKILNPRWIYVEPPDH